MRCTLLQGPAGTFFNTLNKHLVQNGWDVHRFAFDGGDFAFSNILKTEHWVGNKSWRRTFGRHLKDFKPQVVVLFGCERPAHRIARRLCARANIPILSLEEGYVRPGFITAEWGGNNHASPLKNIPMDFSSTFRKTPLPIKPGMTPMLKQAVPYYTSRTLFTLPKQWKLLHRQHFWPAEVSRWGLNVLRKWYHNASDKTLLEKLNAKSFDYDIMALQVPGDQSLVCGGDGWNTKRLILEGLDSFAKNAPKSRHLVIKMHPLARGHSNIHHFIEQLTNEHNISDRVHLCMSGPLAPVLKNARGLITITSTSALSAIEKQKTVLVMGQSVARDPSLSLNGPDKSSLDLFWNSKHHASDANINAFWSKMHTHSLLPGDFYTPSARQTTCLHIQEKIEEKLSKKQ